MKKLLPLLMFCFISFLVKAQGAFTFGPTLHLNISDKTYKPSFGLEAAYWNLHKFPAGKDMEMEFQKGVSVFILKDKLGLA